jgi:hypothetical protein
MSGNGAQHSFIWWARLGYGARGAVYLLVGGLALLAAMGTGGKTTDAKGALQVVMGSPFGNVLLAVLALGLLGYAAWRFIQAVLDADNHGTGAKALAVRGGLLVSSLMHLALAGFAAGLLLGMGGGGGSGGWVAALMGQPYGRWLVLAVAAGILVAAAAHAFKAVKRKYRKHFRMDRKTMEKVEPVIRYGLLARSAVLAVIAFLLGVAAWRYDPQQAPGLQAALEYIRSSPYGLVLLALVSIGLLAFGVYSLLEAWYRRIEVD